MIPKAPNIRPGHRRRFDDAFKGQAVALAIRNGRSQRAIARDLNVPQTVLNRWIKELAEPHSVRTTAIVDRLVTAGPSAADYEHLRRERDALRRLVHFLADEAGLGLQP